MVWLAHKASPNGTMPALFCVMLQIAAAPVSRCVVWSLGFAPHAHASRATFTKSAQRGSCARGASVPPKVRVHLTIEIFAVSPWRCVIQAFAIAPPILGAEMRRPASVERSNVACRISMNVALKGQSASLLSAQRSMSRFRMQKRSIVMTSTVKSKTMINAVWNKQGATPTHALLGSSTCMSPDRAQREYSAKVGIALTSTVTLVALVVLPAIAWIALRRTSTLLKQRRSSVAAINASSRRSPCVVMSGPCAAASLAL
mmetsp:Transcript_42903/g.98443  ORF Transcript_42903/g.98443 Transcript_42903/m.98443 type:complete len:258 (+) Transcript_42903:4391-5164(+)